MFINNTYFFIFTYKLEYKAPYADSATCLAQLTVNATNRFISSSANNQSNYFEILLQEISVKIPISRNRLATDEHFQYVQSISGTNLQFSIQIMNIVLYGISQFAKSDDELSANNSIAVNNGLRFLNGVTGGFFIISHSYFFTHFSFDDVNSKPEFSLTSKIIWAVPIFINAVVFICIKCKKGFIKNFRPEQYIFLILALYDSDTLLIINKVESIFKKEFQLTAKILAFADLIIKNVPLIILQIIYFKSIVTYSIVPLFVLVTTIFKIILGIIRSIIEIFAVRYSEERNQSTFQENKNKKDKNTQIQFEKI
ncbi:12924_t:CDS:2 [Dentiscutata erythropus]|uniref:12924_t:CDS:1 n=1 Tax=Dentiscutata erythropus TaxID=1348616 RepID=A0A9N8WGN0_9GLOM|nr:12924_t:CDS:2 [Dentiscutata erythropus]